MGGVSLDKIVVEMRPRGYYKIRIRTSFPRKQEFDFCVAVIPGESGDTVDTAPRGDEDPDVYFSDKKRPDAAGFARLKPIRIPVKKSGMPRNSREDEILCNFKELIDRPKFDLRKGSCQNWQKISAAECSIAAEHVSKLYFAYCDRVRDFAWYSRAPYALNLESELISYSTWVKYIDFEKGVQYIPDNYEMDALLWRKSQPDEIWDELGPWTNWPDQCGSPP